MELKSTKRRGKYDIPINYLMVFETIWMNRNKELFLFGQDQDIILI